MNEQKENKSTLCWNCKYATGATFEIPKQISHGLETEFMYKCQWACEKKPIPGWTATKKTIKLNKTAADEDGETTYFIQKCPYYELDLYAEIDRLSPSIIADTLGLLLQTVLKRLFLDLCKRILYRLIKKLLKKLSNEEIKNIYNIDPEHFTLEDLRDENGKIDLKKIFGPVADLTKKEVISDMIEENREEIALCESEDDEITIAKATGASNNSILTRYTSHLKRENRRLEEILKSLDQE